MFYLAQVLIGRAVVALNHPFSYWTDDPFVQEGMRVFVSFGASKSTIGFVVGEPEKIEIPLEDYCKEKGIKLSKILGRVDQEPLLNSYQMELAKQVSSFYKSDLIKVLSAFLPPSLKPKDSALKKPQKKVVDFVFALPFPEGKLGKNEKVLYEKIQAEEDGIRLSHITAKASLKKLLDKNAVEKREIPVSRIPELQAKKLKEFSLTKEQQSVYDTVLSQDKKVFLLEGVTGSGKTEVYIRLTEHYLKEGKGVLILVPEIALTDHMADIFASFFQDAISILNSSLSDARKYDEYLRIHNGESKVVLGTRSAIFSPVQNLGLIIIDEEHSSSYKQDSDPFYDAITVGKMRSEIEDCKVLLGSATPRIIDKARALKGIYYPLYMKERYAKNQDKDLIMVNMNDASSLDPKLSSMISKRLIQELSKNLENHEQSMVLINRRGYSPIYICRNCHKTALCPNCNIPLNYHKKDDTLRCHHCGYKVYAPSYQCECSSHDFLTLGYGTERALEELRMIFPKAKITRLDSDVSSNNVRQEVLEDFATGDTDIIVGTQVIAKGHDFTRVTLAAMLDADFSLRLPTYMANEETFDLISQFVGRAGRGDKKGRVLIQTYVPDNQVIQFAAKQDYEGFYTYEIEERKEYQYPPYTYLTSITIKALSEKRSYEVGDAVKQYLLQAIGNKRFNIYGPNNPYIPHINGRYYRNILLKYKNRDEANEVLNGIYVLRLANKDVEISINMDPGSESL